MKDIIIEPLARVEGHGGINVKIEGKKVKDVQVQIYEGPRLIEQLVIGKSPEDVLNIVPRICGICTLSHRYAALRALEKALNINVPLSTKLTRDLMLMGEIIQSHSLHLFFLSLPDFLGYTSSMEMVDNYGEEVKRGLVLKTYGYKIMEEISARMIHGENPILGGFGSYPDRNVLLDIKDKANALIPDAKKTIELFNSFDFSSYPEYETIFIALNPSDRKYGFVGNAVSVSNGDEWDIEEYKKHINEYVVPYSFAKRSKYKESPFTVGAIARINLFGDRLTKEAGKYYRKVYNKRWLKNPLFNNLSQAIEILYCLETIPELVDRILNLKTPKIKKSSLNKGTGTGAVEAPRGTLYHHYSIDNGVISDCDIVTPTAQNLDDIEKYIKITAENLLSNGKDKDIRLNLEMIIRAYDPCISCSAHMVNIIRGKNI